MHGPLPLETYRLGTFALTNRDQAHVLQEQALISLYEAIRDHAPDTSLPYHAWSDAHRRGLNLPPSTPRLRPLAASLSGRLPARETIPTDRAVIVSNHLDPDLYALLQYAATQALDVPFAFYRHDPLSSRYPWYRRLASLSDACIIYTDTSGTHDFDRSRKPGPDFQPDRLDLVLTLQDASNNQTITLTLPLGIAFAGDFPAARYHPENLAIIVAQHNRPTPNIVQDLLFNSFFQADDDDDDDTPDTQAKAFRRYATFATDAALYGTETALKNRALDLAPDLLPPGHAQRYCINVTHGPTGTDVRLFDTTADNPPGGR